MRAVRIVWSTYVCIAVLAAIGQSCFIVPRVITFITQQLLISMGTNGTKCSHCSAVKINKVIFGIHLKYLTRSKFVCNAWVLLFCFVSVYNGSKWCGGIQCSPDTELWIHRFGSLLSTSTNPMGCTPPSNYPLSNNNKNGRPYAELFHAVKGMSALSKELNCHWAFLSLTGSRTTLIQLRLMRVAVPTVLASQAQLQPVRSSSCCDFAHLCFRVHHVSTGWVISSLYQWDQCSMWSH